METLSNGRAVMPLIKGQDESRKPDMTPFDMRPIEREALPSEILRGWRKPKGV